MISLCERSLGQSPAAPFCMAKDSCQELSAELAGEGGVTMCSEGAQDDLNWKVSWGLGVVGTRASFELNGLKRPRVGNGRI